MNNVEVVRTRPLPPSLRHEQMQPASPAQPSLLPLPADGQLDALGAICAYYARSRANDLTAARNDLQAAQNLRRKEWAKVKQALAEAAKAKKQGGFWKKLAGLATRVAKVAAVVGSIALAVSTAGAATPIAALAIAGALMSTAGFVQGETQLLQKLGVDGKTAQWIGVGLSIGGALASGGASLANGVAGGAETAAAAESAMETSGRLATGASGVAHIACGIGRWQAAQSEAESQKKLANAAAARLQEQLLQRLIERTLASLEDAQKYDERVLAQLRGSMEVKHQALLESAVRV